MATLRSASEHQRILSLLMLEAHRRVAQSRRQLLTILTAYQAAALQAGARSVGSMLDEQGIDAPAEADVRAAALVGWASDGRPMAGLADAVASRPPWVLDMIVMTQVADAGRIGAALGMASRPSVTRYVRQVSPGACSRCIILAGREYRSAEAFDRHPRCNCVHIPTAENVAGDVSTDPQAYFDSLSKVEQDRTFTKAGAEAIRLGADPAQVVNARAGMSTAQVATRGRGDRWTASGRLTRTRVFGQDVFTTTEGMTKRGVAYKARGGKPVRLMPESIIELADTPAERIRLLKAHGYLL